MPRWDDDLFFVSAVELNRRLRAKEFSAVEVVRAFAARMEQFGPRFRALVLPLFQESFRQAQDVDKELKRGRTRGPLQGVPYAVSDLLSVAGRPTAWGSALFAGQVFDDNAAAVDRLSNAKAIVTAKLSTVELGGVGGNPGSAAGSPGPTLNPWDKSRWSGGAASGVAAAVGAGLTPFALGMESCGSLVLPCAFCGVTALRPTYGLVSRHGALTGSWSLDKIGIAARTAEDCGHVLNVIAGADGRDPAVLGKKFHYAPHYSRPLEKIRIGYSRDEFEKLPAEGLRRPLLDALAVLRQSGAQLVEISWPALPFAEVAQLVIAAEAAAFFSEEIASGQLAGLADQRQASGLRAGGELKAVEYLNAMRVRRLIQESLAKSYVEVDILASPTSYRAAPKLADIQAEKSSASTLMTFTELPPMIAAGNLAGLPAMTFPCGLADGVPVGMLLTGKPLGENLLLRTAEFFQSGTNWNKQRPTPW